MPQWDWHVTLVDENGTAVSVGGGTQYADGATQANPTGTVALWLDTSNVLRAASAAKPLPVNIISGAGGSQTDASAWTTAVTSFAPGGGVFNDSAADLTSGQQGTLRMTAKRAQHINLRNASAAEIGIAAAPLISAGNLTNNNAVPAATNYGALTALANAAAPSITEGRQTLLSTDLSGGLRALIPQLPTAAALSDATANPTTVMIGAATMGWDGSAWERPNLVNGSSDARGSSLIGLVQQSFGYGWNGSNWARMQLDGSNFLKMAVQSSIPGTAATNLGKAEDAGHTSGDTGVFSLAVRQDTQSALAGTTLDYIPFTTDQNGSLRGVSGGYTTVITSTLTRVNNTTPYAAGDEVTNSTSAPTILTLTNIARFSGGSGIIQGVAASFSDLWGTKPSLELWVFDTTSTPSNDHTAFAPSDGVVDTLVAVIPLTATYVGDATGTTGNFSMDTGPVNYPFLTSGSANLFFRIVIRNAGTPAVVSSTIKFRFRVLQD